MSDHFMMWDNLSDAIRDINALDDESREHLCIGDSKPCQNSVTAKDIDGEYCERHWTAYIGSLEMERDRIMTELTRRIGEVV